MSDNPQLVEATFKSGGRTTKLDIPVWFDDPGPNAKPLPNPVAAAYARGRRDGLREAANVIGRDTIAGSFLDGLSERIRRLAAQPQGEKGA